MNNDRLNFRAWSTVYLIDDKDQDYEKSFLLYNVDLFKGYIVGIRREDFEDQLEKQGFSEDEIEQIEQGYNVEYYDGDYLSIDVDEIDQCTGLKDKNGKLIFESDIIKKPYNDFYEYSIHVISWEDGAYTTKRCLVMKNKKSGELIDCSNGGFCFSSHITQELANSFEVIGNIHENKELLK